MVTEAQFPFLAEKGHVVSLVGGGGKTTLLYALSEHCARRGWRVLAGTTTHIRQPKQNFAAADADVKALWAAGAFAVLGTPDGSGKLTAPPPRQLEHWMEQADAVFLEADGAKRLPCKAPAAHEPVLLPQSDIVLALAGLSALDRPLREVCFRYDTIRPQFLAAAPDAPLTPPVLAQLLASTQGGRKAVGDRQFYAVLNQADTPELQQQGIQIQQLLRQHGIKCELTHFEEEERA